MTTLAHERRFLSTAEAAAALGVSVSTIRRAVADGSLIPVRIRPTGRLRFRADDIAAIARRGIDSPAGIYGLPAGEAELLDRLRDDLDAREADA